MLYKPAFYIKFQRDCRRLVCVATFVLVVAGYLLAFFLHEAFAIPFALAIIYMWQKVSRIWWSIHDRKFEAIPAEHGRTFKLWRRNIGI